MKRSDNDFSILQRQSPGVIGVAVVNYLQAVFRQALWPLLIVYFVGRSTDTFTQVAIGISIFAGVFSVGAAVIKYYYFHFVFKNGQLRVSEGLLKKRNLSVPREKIQRVEFEQNVIHRLLKVVTLRIETAGAEGEELEIGALPLDEAKALRELLLSGSKTTTEVSDSEAEKPVFHLSLGQLFKASLVRNHFRTFGIVMGFLASIYFQLEDVIDLDEWMSKWLPQWYYSSDITSGFIYILPPILVFVVLLTVVRTFIQYFNFGLWRTGDGFKVAYGLFSRHTNSALNIKVQYLRWRDNVLMRLASMYGMFIYQATSVSAKRDQSIQIPFCYRDQVDLVIGDVYPEYGEDILQVFQPSSRYRNVIFFRWGVIPAALAAIYAYIDGWSYTWIWGMSVWLIFIMIYAFYYVKTMYIKVGKEHIFIERGIFERSRWLLKMSKLQGLTLSQNPFEQRGALSSVNLFTAAGSVRFPYLDINLANDIQDYILFKIETNKATWM